MSPTRVRSAPWTTALALAGAGCWTGVADHGEQATDGAGEHGSDEAGDELPPEEEEVVGVSGLRRLTAAEYDQTLIDLVGDDAQNSELLLPEDVRTPFDNDYTIQAASQALIEAADLLASDAVERLLADPDRRDLAVGCTPTGAGDEACLRSFITAFGRRALRRPLRDAEIDAFVQLLDYAVERDDFYFAVGSVVRALLQHPEFLYRVEIGEPVPDSPGVFRLTDHELGARLSYFIWGSTPSDELLDLADAGDLGTNVADVAASMMEDPRAVDRFTRFHSMWMGYEKLPPPAEIATLMREETKALMQRVIFDEKRAWHDLFRFEETFLNDTLAEHYGMQAPGSTASTWTSYGDSGRRGLLSHGAFLTIGAKFDDTSPTIRGKLIRTRLFCQDIPPPPPNVNTDEEPGDGNAVCKWDRYAVHRDQATGCYGCHVLMDPVGFGLENYDHLGRYREVEGEHPECVIEGRGELAEIGEFSGPGELQQLMLEAGVLNECAIEQLYRFSMGRSELDKIDEAFIDMLSGRMGDGDFRFDELVVELVSTPAFRHRRNEEE